MKPSLKRIPLLSAVLALAGCGGNPFAPEAPRPPDNSELPPPADAATAAVTTRRCR